MKLLDFGDVPSGDLNTDRDDTPADQDEDHKFVRDHDEALTQKVSKTGLI
jgi:hypothetical protein